MSTSCSTLARDRSRTARCGVTRCACCPFSLATDAVISFSLLSLLNDAVLAVDHFSKALLLKLRELALQAENLANNRMAIDSAQKLLDELKRLLAKFEKEQEVVAFCTSTIASTETRGWALKGRVRCCSS